MEIDILRIVSTVFKSDGSVSRTSTNRFLINHTEDLLIGLFTFYNRVETDTLDNVNK